MQCRTKQTSQLFQVSGCINMFTLCELFLLSLLLPHSTQSHSALHYAALFQHLFTTTLKILMQKGHCVLCNLFRFNRIK